MSILIGFLTFILVFISVFLILLVLVQLPKKETGGGMAFGAGMSEMLLGAGSGNVLTRITKYSVVAFLSLSLLLSILVSNQARKSGLAVTRAIEDKARSSASPAPAPPLTPANPGLQPLVATTNAVATPPAIQVSTTIVVNPTAAPTTPTPKPATPAAPATNKPGGL